jgi:hypothetical protein
MRAQRPKMPRQTWSHAARGTISVTGSKPQGNSRALRKRNEYQNHNPQSDSGDRYSMDFIIPGHRGHRGKSECLSLCPLCPLWFSPSPAFFPFVRVAISLDSTEKLNLCGLTLPLHSSFTSFYFSIAVLRMRRCLYSGNSRPLVSGQNQITTMPTI